MSGIEKLIQDAWQNKVLPRLLKDRAEFERRKARMNAPALSRPPRAWCLAIRASDRRIEQLARLAAPLAGRDRYASERWENAPARDSAVERSERAPRAGPLNGVGRCSGSEHVVHLDACTLRNLCRPIVVTPGGETWDELAKKLGTGFTGLRHARMRGRLRARYVKNLGGRWGAPVPILASDDLLDPGARGWVSCDPIWGVSTCDLLERVPGDFSAELMRVPLYRSHARKGEFDDSLHPEVRNSPRVQKRERLAPPPPDYVWY